MRCADPAAAQLRGAIVTPTPPARLYFSRLAFSSSRAELAPARVLAIKILFQRY